MNTIELIEVNLLDEIKIVKDEDLFICAVVKAGKEKKFFKIAKDDSWSSEVWEMKGTKPSYRVGVIGSTTNPLMSVSFHGVKYEDIAEVIKNDPTNYKLSAKGKVRIELNEAIANRDAAERRGHVDFVATWNEKIEKLTKKIEKMK